MSFLKAEWRKLILVNYVVSQELLQKYVPSGTQLDTWNGKCYVSLVGFLFKDTRVLGMKIPGHINFEEVNLRFYVKREVDGEVRRGVVFIREIVPKPAITFVANTIYKENYVTRKMDRKVEFTDQDLLVKYSWMEDGQEQQFSVNAELDPVGFELGSEEEFITEHYWGYAMIDKNRTNEYEVTHPRWLVYPVKEHAVQVDFSLVYGEEFSVLNDLDPNSIFLAEGSEITVESKKRI